MSFFFHFVVLHTENISLNIVIFLYLTQIFITSSKKSSKWDFPSRELFQINFHVFSERCCVQHAFSLWHECFTREAFRYTCCTAQVITDGKVERSPMTSFTQMQKISASACVCIRNSLAFKNWYANVDVKYSSDFAVSGRELF